MSRFALDYETVCERFGLLELIRFLFFVKKLLHNVSIERFLSFWSFSLQGNLVGQFMEIVIRTELLPCFFGVFIVQAFSKWSHNGYRNLFTPVPDGRYVCTGDGKSVIPQQVVDKLIMLSPVT